MPNVTITVPEELKAQMDKFSEVSWSEICRNAISQYISQRENPTPKIELDIRSTRLYVYTVETGYPTLTIDVRIQNRMSSEIIIDRILATVWSRAQDNQSFGFGQATDLHRRMVGSSSVGLATIRLAFTREMLRQLKDVFKSTFHCYVDFTVFVDCFKDAYRQEVDFQIPIDTWNDVVTNALGTNQATQ